MVIADGGAGGVDMDMTYADVVRATEEDDLAPEETRDIPFFGFVTGMVISLGIWSVIAWTIWAMVD
jgi:hypothetical protein